MLSESRLSPELEAALRAYAAGSGVIDYVVFDVAAAHASPALHREAALLAMTKLAVDSIHKQPAEPARISVNTFVGPHYDWLMKSLIDPWQRSAGGRSAQRDSAGEQVTHGYADAFSDPPYRLSLDLERASALFRTINTELFGGLHAELEIFSWPTDWSSYFEPGHEWWGAFYWTVYARSTQRLVVIAAASTD